MFAVIFSAVITRSDHCSEWSQASAGLAVSVRGWSCWGCHVGDGLAVLVMGLTVPVVIWPCWWGTGCVGTGGILCGVRVAVSEPVVQKKVFTPIVSFHRLFCLKIVLEINFHPLF